MRGARIVLGEKFSLLSSSSVKNTKNSNAQNVRLHGEGGGRASKRSNARACAHNRRNNKSSAATAVYVSAWWGLFLGGWLGEAGRVKPAA